MAFVHARWLRPPLGHLSFSSFCIQPNDWSFSSTEGRPWTVQIKSNRHCRILSVPLEKSHLIPKGYLLPIESNAINFSLAQNVYLPLTRCGLEPDRGRGRSIPASLLLIKVYLIEEESQHELGCRSSSPAQVRRLASVWGESDKPEMDHSVISAKWHVRKINQIPAYQHHRLSISHLWNILQCF